MLQAMQDLVEHSKNFGLLIIAMIGGMLGYISREISNRRKVQFLRVLFAGSAAAFFALLIKTLVIKSGGDLEWALIAICVFSWIGADTTANILLKSILKKFGMSYGFYKLEDTGNNVGDNSGFNNDSRFGEPEKVDVEARTRDSEARVG